ncbi:phage major capsid protein [Nesterenkonia rhizosphaerae]|uniref:Phage major capsid protein n=1 Tax=Nesterenkonia rhizosphaerae TaxID=1348272 RepID=A0ABP9G8D2_9MICC
MPLDTQHFAQHNLLPKKMSNKIWDIARENSVVPSLTTQEPVIIGDNIIPTIEEKPRASMIGEGQRKRSSDLRFGSETLFRGKAVVLTEVSLETTLANPVETLRIIQESFGSALATQIDLAILHNRDALTGEQISQDANCIADTTQRVVLSEDVNRVKKDINAASALVASHSLVPNGVALDPAMIARMVEAENPQTGAELYPNLNIGATNAGLVNGLRSAVGDSVSGRTYDDSEDSGIRGVVGRWDAVRWGKTATISMKKIEYGDPTGNGDLQARNYVAFMSEILFGWRVLDVNKAFAAIETGAEAPDTTE